jgi:hypothetical protein
MLRYSGIQFLVLLAVLAVSVFSKRQLIAFGHKLNEHSDSGSRAMLVYGDQTGLYSSKYYCQIRDLINDAKENALTLSYHYEKRRTLQQSNPGAFRKGLSRNEERTCNEAFESLKKKVQDLRNILLGNEMNIEATDELTQYTHQNAVLG